MKLIMFDIDGTLTQSVHADEACFLRALADVFGFVDVDTDWTTYPHCSDGGIVHTLVQQRRGRPPRPDETDAMRTAFAAHLTQAIAAQPIAAVPGAAALIDRLTAGPGPGPGPGPGFAVSLASGAWECSARLKLASAGLHLPHIPAAFSDDAHAREDIMRASLARAAQLHARDSFDSVVYIGDGVWDARACRNLGYPFIGIARDPARTQRLYTEGARQVFHDYLDAEGFLAAIA